MIKLSIPRESPLLKKALQLELFPMQDASSHDEDSRWSDDLLRDIKRMKTIRYNSVVLSASRPLPGFTFHLYNCHRAIFVHRLLFEMEAEMKAVISVGSWVERYHEDDDGAEITVNGETRRGDVIDVVIHVDGVKSCGRFCSSWVWR